MSNHTVSDQHRFLIQWFRTWSDYQKEDFTQIIAHKLNPSHFINGLLVNGIQHLTTGGSGDTNTTNERPPSLFSCQMKLFTEWWDTWKQEDKDNFATSLKESDPKFWINVEDELSGSRKKGDEEFFAIISNMTTDGKESKGVLPDIINNQVVSNITTTTAVKVDLVAHDVSNSTSTIADVAADTVNVTIAAEEPNGLVKQPERVRINGTEDGVLVIEEDNDEII